MDKQSKFKERKDYGDYIGEGATEEAKQRKLDDIDVKVIVSGRKVKMPEAIFLFQVIAGELAYRTAYSVSTFRVLFFFLAISKYENFISVDVKTISEELDISLSAVKRATKQLADDNIIIKVPHETDARRHDYFLNPHGVWKGKMINRNKAIKKAKDNQIQLNIFPNDNTDNVYGIKKSRGKIQ
jgi:DNA-binding MarR family transcriptional regulator